MVHFNRRARLPVAAGTIALVAALALTGCTTPLQSAIEKVVGSQTFGSASKIVADTEAPGAELMVRGFTEEGNTSVGGAMSVASYANADLRVSLGTIGGAGDRALQIQVTQILER